MDGKTPREGWAALVLRHYHQRRAGVARIRQTWLPSARIRQPERSGCPQGALGPARVRSTRTPQAPFAPQASAAPPGRSQAATATTPMFHRCRPDDTDVPSVLPAAFLDKKDQFNGL
jgi:hypothetical protein